MKGIPPGLPEAILSVLSTSPAPRRRREILEELEHRGHRVSLAGLNRALQQCAESGRTEEGPSGVRLRRSE